MNWLQVQVVHPNKGVVRHRNDTCGWLFSITLQPGEVFRVPQAIGITKGFELLEKDAVQIGEFFEHATGCLIQTLLLPNVVARKCILHLVAKTLVALLDEQNIQLFIIEAEDDTIAGDVGIDSWLCTHSSEAVLLNQI